MFLSVFGLIEGTYTIKHERESQALINELLMRFLKILLFNFAQD